MSLRAVAIGVALLAGSVGASLAGPSAASAHGPCPDCVEPASAQPGEPLIVHYRTFRAVLNPTYRQLTKGPKPYCYGCQLGLWRSRLQGVPSIDLGSWRPPRGRLRLRAPSVPPGKYLLALFDGSEGGTHYTWDFVRISAASDRDVGGNAAWRWGLVAAIVVAALLFATLLWRRQRPHQA